MTVFENFKNKTIDEIVEWLDEHGAFDNFLWIQWFDQKYCKQCESEFTYVSELDKKCECAWCELNGKCRFFKELDDTPDNKQIIRMWLESEYEYGNGELK